MHVINSLPTKMLSPSSVSLSTEHKFQVLTLQLPVLHCWGRCLGYCWEQRSSWSWSSCRRSSCCRPFKSALPLLEVLWWRWWWTFLVFCFFFLFLGFVVVVSLRD
ncbi:hypothetical protein L208DRAFT_231920 [Tricholoma matsutake]|nr:hypothetical protein L208DRAFT_231920 [Tricholoma matsutake 945]